MKKINHSLIFALIIFPFSLAAQGGPPNEEGWSFSLGAGAISSPTYLGDNSYLVAVVPSISVTHSSGFFASIPTGVGYNFINTDRWRVGPIARIDFGRDEDGNSPFQVAGHKGNDLLGLDEIDASIEVGGFVEYSYQNYSAKVELRRAVNGHDGLLGDIEFRYNNVFPFNGRTAIWSFGPGLVFADSNYLGSFFDVTTTQSAVSGLTQFSAGSGLVRYGINGSLVLPLTDKISLIGITGYDRLGGDAADSSLVKERGSRDQLFLGTILNYRF